MKKKILSLSQNKTKLLSWSKMQFKPFKLEKGSKAGVVLDKENVPHYFIFDVFAFLDILSTIDESLSDKLDHQDYYSQKHNPAGWLIDEIEAKLPLNPNLVPSLEEALSEAGKKGWIPFEELKSGFKHS